MPKFHVTAPDGKTLELEGPEGSTQEDALAQAQTLYKPKASLKETNPAEYDPSSESYQERYGPLSKGRTRQQAIRGVGTKTVPEDDTLTEGIGSGMVRADKGLTNFFMKTLNKHPLIKAFGEIPTPSYASDENINAQDATDAPLAQTTKGSIGQAVGQTAVGAAVTAPLGGIGGAAGGGGLVARTVANPMVRAGVEGAAAGAGAADPNDQGAGALRGAATSVAGERALSVLGRTMRGVVKKSDAAKNLEQLVGQHDKEIFVPISQAASEDDIVSRLSKIAYAEGLPLVPGVKTQLKRQAAKAEEEIRGIALKEATPDGVQLPENAGANVAENMHALKRGFDETYEQTVKSYAFNVSPTFKDEVAARIRAKLPKADNTTVQKVADEAEKLMNRFSSGKNVIDGGNLLNVKNELGLMVGKVSRPEKGAFEIAQEHVNDIIQQELKQGNSASNIADLKKFNDLTEPYRHFSGLRKAARAAKAKKGNFSMDQLANKATDPTQLDLAQQAGEVLRNPAAGTSFAGRSLVGAGGLATTAVTAGLPAAAAVVAGSNLLATKTIQKALMGDLAAQRTVASAVEKNPKVADQVSRMMRVMAAQEAGAGDVGHN